MTLENKDMSLSHSKIARLILLVGLLMLSFGGGVFLFKGNTLSMPLALYPLMLFAGLFSEYFLLRSKKPSTDELLDYSLSNQLFSKKPMQNILDKVLISLFIGTGLIFSGIVERTEAVQYGAGILMWTLGGFLVFLVARRKGQLKKTQVAG